MKILVVDDEQLDLFITRKLLSIEYDVEGFTSVQDAVQWARSNRFDVLLSDYYLGQGMHAHDVLQAIGAAAAGFRAIVLSNHIDDEQAKSLRKAGFSAILEKPVTLEKFKDAVLQAG